MADVTKLKGWVDSYAVGVRSGTITPCMEDEAYVRRLFGLPAMPQAVMDEWAKAPTRSPVTLQKEEDQAQIDAARESIILAPVKKAERKKAAKPKRSKRTARELDPVDPRLEDSEFPAFDLTYALDLQANWPEIWEAGGNIRGNDAFEYWKQAANGDMTEDVKDWIVEREGWAARHFGDGAQFKEDAEPVLSNIAGVVAQIKWGVIGTLGLDRMIEVIETVKGKLSPRE